MYALRKKTNFERAQRQSLNGTFHASCGILPPHFFDTKEYIKVQPVLDLTAFKFASSARPADQMKAVTHICRQLNEHLITIDEIIGQHFITEWGRQVNRAKDDLDNLIENGFCFSKSRVFYSQTIFLGLLGQDEKKNGCLFAFMSCRGNGIVFINFYWKSGLERRDVMTDIYDDRYVLDEEEKDQYELFATGFKPEQIRSRFLVFSMQMNLWQGQPRRNYSFWRNTKRSINLEQHVWTLMTNLKEAADRMIIPFPDWTVFTDRDLEAYRHPSSFYNDNLSFSVGDNVSVRSWFDIKDRKAGLELFGEEGEEIVTAISRILQTKFTAKKERILWDAIQNESFDTNSFDPSLSDEANLSLLEGGVMLAVQTPLTQLELAFHTGQQLKYQFMFPFQPFTSAVQTSRHFEWSLTQEEIHVSDERFFDCITICVGDEVELRNVNCNHVRGTYMFQRVRSPVPNAFNNWGSDIDCTLCDGCSAANTHSMDFNTGALNKSPLPTGAVNVQLVKAIPFAIIFQDNWLTRNKTSAADDVWNDHESCVLEWDGLLSRKTVERLQAGSKETMYVIRSLVGQLNMMAVQEKLVIQAMYWDRWDDFGFNYIMWARFWLDETDPGLHSLSLNETESERGQLLQGKDRMNAIGKYFTDVVTASKVLCDNLPPPSIPSVRVRKGSKQSMLTPIAPLLDRVCIYHEGQLSKQKQSFLFDE